MTAGLGAVLRTISSTVSATAARARPPDTCWRYRPDEFHRLAAKRWRSCQRAMASSRARPTAPRASRVWPTARLLIPTGPRWSTEPLPRVRLATRLNSECHVATVYGPRMEVAELAHLRRARDLLDREYGRPLDVPVMARAALMSPSLFSRRFREAYGDTPYGYLQARRVERAMALLRSGHMSVTDVCTAVGFTSLGSFSSTFTRLVGEPPSAYKARDHSRLTPVPPCMTRAWARPGWIAQPCRIGEAFLAGRA